MFVQKRKDRHGNVYFSFSYDDSTTKKRIRLKKEDHPHFSKREDALAWAATQNAMRAARLDMLAKKEAWKTSYYQFNELRERFEKWMMERAPNSWENTMVHFEHYGLYFFLELKKASNINHWHFMFQDYRHWLQHEARTRVGRPIAFSTSNHAIKAINNFLTFLGERGEIDKDSSRKCPLFADHLLAQKGFESVIEAAEFNQMHLRMKEIDEDVADLFFVLYETGMRIHEVRSLQITALMKGLMEGPVQDELVEKKLEYVGYIPGRLHLNVLDGRCFLWIP